jgi:DNA-binding NarL/FixJ family response regulator
VVDDYEPWRSFASTTLQKRPELQVVGEASDGLEAIQKAQELRPDLILLDIGLPAVNGIEAARRILQYAPNAKILFVSQERSSDIVQEALRTGACGYVLKSSAATELLPAVEAVLHGNQFVSASLTASAFGDHENKRTTHDPRLVKVAPTALSNVDTARRHEVGFYADDRRLLDDVTQFIGAALSAGNAAVVVATESHRNSLLPRLQVQGMDIGAAIEQGRYISLDATDALSTFMVDDRLDPVRFVEAFSNLIATAARAANGVHPRVVVFGEATHLLWTRGNVQAVIEDEKLCNELTKIYDVDFLCGYSVGSVHGEMEAHIFQQICTQHSAVHSR